MALQMDFYDRRTDTTYPNSYWKIGVDTGIIGGKTLLYIEMLCYENREHADTNIDEITQLDFEFSPDLGTVDDFLAQAYKFIKESPFFEDAIDV